MAIRQITPLTARGMTLLTSLVSPAATPTISVPAYANTTDCRVISTTAKPIGKNPPALVRLLTLAWVFPTPAPVSTSTTPVTRKLTIASTFTAANQNSSSPNSLTVTRLTASSTASAPRALTHCGTDGAQN